MSKRTSPSDAGVPTIPQKQLLSAAFENSRHILKKKHPHRLKSIDLRHQMRNAQGRRYERTVSFDLSAQAADQRVSRLKVCFLRSGLMEAPASFILSTAGTRQVMEDHRTAF